MILDPSTLALDTVIFAALVWVVAWACERCQSRQSSKRPHPYR